MTRPLRWTVLATPVPPGGSLGGIVRYTTELMRALARREDVELSALATRDAFDTVAAIVGDPGRVSTVPDVPTPLLSVVERRAPLGAIHRDTDVVQGTKHLVPARSDALRVLTVHDMLLLDRASDFGRLKRHLLPASYRASIHDADLLVCVSAATRERLLVHAPDTASRTAVVHLATSPSLLDATPREVPDLVGRRFALVVGDPSPRKNIATLMAAWPQVRAVVPDAVLAVAGPPSWGRTELGETYRSLQADGAVVPLGHIDDAGLRWAYEHARVVLCPSLAEGFGLPAAEALDLGAPVVVSDDPALVEVSDGAARAVVPATDVAGWARAITTALTADDRAPGRPRRSWDDVADETVAAVRDALARRTHARRVA